MTKGLCKSAVVVVCGGDMTLSCPLQTVFVVTDSEKLISPVQARNQYRSKKKKQDKIKDFQFNCSQPVGCRGQVCLKNPHLCVFVLSTVN